MLKRACFYAVIGIVVLAMIQYQVALKKNEQTRDTNINQCQAMSLIDDGWINATHLSDVLDNACRSHFIAVFLNSSVDDAKIRMVK